MRLLLNSLELLLSFAVILLTISCNNPFTPRDGNIEKPVTPAEGIWQDPVSSDLVISNFEYVYNFRNNSLSVDGAIAKYRDMFEENDNGFQYEFTYTATNEPGSPQKFMSYAEEMASTEKMFTTIAAMDLELDLRTFDIKEKWKELRENSLEHPTEDWKVYLIAVQMVIQTEEKDFWVEGDAEFKIRKSSDGFYRIIRWIDLTKDDNNSTKVSSAARFPNILQKIAWSKLKNTYNN